MAFNANFFLKNLRKYRKCYSPEKLMDKIKRYGRLAGLKTVHAVLILYYASLDKGVPAKDRLMIMAALGYFILPVDLIPDMLPLGFTDDMAALTFVLRTIWGNLTPSVFEKAKAKLQEWFGLVTDADIAIPGLSK